MQQLQAENQISSISLMSRPPETTFYHLRMCFTAQVVDITEQLQANLAEEHKLLQVCSRVFAGVSGGVSGCTSRQRQTTLDRMQA